MKIGVISDTHDQQELILQCVQKLNEAGVGLVIKLQFFMVTIKKSFKH